MKKLYRSETDKKIAGICGGIGELIGVDPTVIRLLAIVLCLATAVFPFLIGYLLAWWIVPLKGEISPQTPL
ncbi:MAG TPA: PspC domain-containing protein [Bacteroidota bacterium]|nr:PspC domain-containing protein [Bacteroidota bacterium]